MKKVEHPGPAPWRTGETAEPVIYSRTRESNETTGKRGGVFRGNRGLMITLIDIVVVTLLFIIFYTLLLPLSRNVSIEPYVMEIDHTLDENVLEISVLINHRTPGIFSKPLSTSSNLIQPVVTVRAGNVSVADLAPREGQQRKLVFQVPLSATEGIDGKSRQLDLAFQIGDETKTHRIDLR